MGVFLEHGVIKVEQTNYSEQAHRENCDGENNNHWGHNLVEPFAAWSRDAHWTVFESSTDIVISHFQEKWFAPVQLAFDGVISHEDQEQRNDIGE